MTNERITQQDIDIISHIVGVKPKILEALFTSSTQGVLAPHQRRGYCEICILNDVREGRYPASRLSWSYLWVSVCDIHGTPLSTTKKPIQTETLIEIALKEIYEADRYSSTLDYNANLDLRCSTYSLCKNVRTGRDVMILLSYLFQAWMTKSVANGHGTLANGVVPFEDIIELIELLGRIAFRKTQANSGYNSPVLFFLRPQYRPKLRDHDGRSIDDALSIAVGDIPAGDRIGFFALVGALIEVGNQRDLLGRFMRKIWMDGFIWDMPRDLLDDNNHDLRNWAKLNIKTNNIVALSLLDRILDPGATIGLSNLRSYNNLRKLRNL